MAVSLRALKDNWKVTFTSYRRCLSLRVSWRPSKMCCFICLIGERSNCSPNWWYLDQSIINMGLSKIKIRQRMEFTSSINNLKKKRTCYLYNHSELLKTLPVRALKPVHFRMNLLHLSLGFTIVHWHRCQISYQRFEFCFWMGFNCQEANPEITS